MVANKDPVSSARLNDGRAADHRPDWRIVLVACGTWLGLWYLTPGLLSEGVGSRFSDDLDVAVLVESAIAALIATVLLLTHRKYSRTLFARSRLMWLYALPAVLALVLPFHYSQQAPVAVYLVFMTVSVFWQDYLTFGLLQSYVSERLPAWATVAVVTGMFWLGHALLLPEKFAPTNVLATSAILALGAVFALIRARLGTLHLLLILHLSFGFIFA